MLDLAEAPDKVDRLRAALVTLPQYEPETDHYFHGGMYCRRVFRHADVTIVGKVHKKEHFYLIASGTVAVTTDNGVAVFTGPHLLCSTPGTRRAVYSVTDAVCMTFHRTDALTVEDAEIELVEDDPDSMFTIGNKLKCEVLS